MDRVQRIIDWLKGLKTPLGAEMVPDTKAAVIAAAIERGDPFIGWTPPPDEERKLRDEIFDLRNRLGVGPEQGGVALDDPEKGAMALLLRLRTTAFGFDLYGDGPHDPIWDEVTALLNGKSS